MNDVLCKQCGNKLYDAKKNLRYWFTDPLDHKVQYGCIYCGRAYTLAERNTWPIACQSASPDVHVFDANADKWGLCPPTVFRRFKARLDELTAKHRPIPNAQALLDEVWAKWKAEQE